MLRLSAVVGVPVLGACAARSRAGCSEATPQVARPTAAKGAWLFSAHMETRRSGFAVNGEEAARGAMPRDRPTEFTGVAPGSEVTAMCAPRMVAHATLQVPCLVTVDQERAATLAFLAGTRRTD